MELQQFMQEWERQHNPFFPSEMRWSKQSRLKLLSDFADHNSRQACLGLLNWMNDIAVANPLQLETDIDNIVELYLLTKKAKQNEGH